MDLKIDWNRKYTTIAVYVCIVITFAVVLSTAAAHLDAVWGAVVKAVTVLNPAIVGFCIAFLINPMMMLCERRLFAFVDRKKPHPVLKRVLSLISAYLIISALIFLFIYMVVPQIVESFNDLQKKTSVYFSGAHKYVADVIDSDKGGIGNFVRELLDGDAIKQNIMQIIKGSYDILVDISPYIINFATNILNSLKNALIGIIFSVYFLYSKEKLCAQVKKAVYALFSRKRASRMVRMTRTTRKVFQGFIVGKIIDSIIIGFLTFFVLLIFRMPYAPLVSVIVGVTNVVPFFGPIVGAIPGAFIIFIADPIKSLWFLVIILAIQQLDGNVIGPAILGDSTNMSALWVVFSIIFMSGILGITGMFIGVPLFATLYALFVEYANKRLIAKGKSRRLITYYGKGYGKIKQRPDPESE